MHFGQDLAKNAAPVNYEARLIKKRIFMQSLDDIVKELDRAVNNKDKEAVLAFYEESSFIPKI